MHVPLVSEEEDDIDGQMLHDPEDVSDDTDINEIIWSEANQDVNVRQFHESTGPQVLLNANVSEMECFKTFFTTEIINKVVQEGQTNLNAACKQQLAGRNDTNWTETDFAEMSAYFGCYSLNTSVKNAFHRGLFIFEHNSAFECSMACPDNSLEYIFLRGRECLCIPRNKFYKLMEENTGTCNQSCDGNTGDLCGGASVVDEKLLYSAYIVITRNKISTKKVGDTCAVLHFKDKRQHLFRYTTCNSNHMYFCERYDKSDKSYKEKCPEENASWYIANKKCKVQDSQLRSYTSSRFLSLCFRREETFWIGNHVAERIVWANDSLPKDALCLKLVITESGSNFETENCSISLHSLCYKRQHPSSEKNDEAYPTTVLSKVDSSTGPRYTFSEVENNQTIKENYVKYLTAVSIVLVLSVIIAGTAFCIKRRFRQKLYTSFIPPQPQIYSDLNTNPYDEITDLNMPQNVDDDGYEIPRSAKIASLG